MLNAKTVRWFLYNFDRLKDDILNLEETLRSLKLCEIDFHIPCIADSDGSQHSISESSSVERQVVELDERTLKYKRELLFKRRLLRAINCVIYYMPDDGLDWKIIKMRYLGKIKWDNIAVKLNYSEAYLKERDQFLINEIIGNFNVRR